MDIKLIPSFADAIKEYYKNSELIELADLFDVELEFDQDFDVTKPAYVKIARTLVTQIEHGNNRRFLEALVPSLLLRCRSEIAHAKKVYQSWEDQDRHLFYHLHLRAVLLKITEEFGEGKIPTEVTISEDRPFTAKSEVRELLGMADTEIVVVDNYVGIRTLDCFRGVRHPIRLLTGARSNSVEEGFDRALQDFRSEGYAIEVRRHQKLHDRYILFDDRCWLVGSSLKDAGKKTFSRIELVDSKPIIVAEIERKWAEAIEYAV